MNAGEDSVIIVIGLRRNSQVLYEIVSNTSFTLPNYCRVNPGQASV